MRANLARLAEYVRGKSLKLRPHTKTHKSVEIATMQIGLGAAGLTVAKPGEAEVMAQAGDDLLVAYPILDQARCGQLAKLAGGKTVRVAVDSPAAAAALGAAASVQGTTIGVLVDLDVGFHRTGLQTPADAAALARLVHHTPGLRLDGLFFYPGHVWSAPAEQATELEAISGKLAEALDLFGRDGLPCPVVSGGSTPTAYQSHLIRGVTEIRPGTYVFNDMNTVRGGFCELSDCAATVRCTIVSDAVPGKVVVDAGTKTLTSDRNAKAGDSGFGHVVEYPQAKVVRLSEEHGEIDIRECGSRPRLGERVHIIPNHICPCINLHDEVVIRDADGSERIAPVDARGRVR